MARLRIVPSAMDHIAAMARKKVEKRVCAMAKRHGDARGKVLDRDELFELLRGKFPKAGLRTIHEFVNLVLMGRELSRKIINES